MSPVYIVFGVTGEYSDKSDWPVMGFDNQPDAEAFALICKQAANALNEGRNFGATRPPPKHPHDPNFRADYNGTDYYVAGPIEIVEPGGLERLRMVDAAWRLKT